MDSIKPTRPGDACQCAGCTGRMVVYCTRVNVIAAKRIRYMQCDECGNKPERNIWVLPLEYAPVRTNASTDVPASH